MHERNQGDVEKDLRNGASSQEMRSTGTESSDKETSRQGAASLEKGSLRHAAQKQYNDRTDILLYSLASFVAILYGGWYLLFYFIDNVVLSPEAWKTHTRGDLLKNFLVSIPIFVIGGLILWWQSVKWIKRVVRNRR